MTTKVREGSRFGACTVLGELICETTTRYVYRRTRGDETFFVSKTLPRFICSHARCARTIASATRQRNSHKDKNSA
jgi:hypothetical protein